MTGSLWDSRRLALFSAFILLTTTMVTAATAFNPGLEAPGSVDDGRDSIADPQVDELQGLERTTTFVPNHGQWDDEVEYKMDSAGMDFFLTEDSAVATLVEVESEAEPALNEDGDPSPPELRPYAVSMDFEGASDDVTLEGLEEADHEISYFVGDDEGAWASGITPVEGVLYEGLYEGIDVEWKGLTDRVPKYDVNVDPGTDLGQFQMSFGGVDDVSTNDDGDLVLETSVGEIVQPKPVSWQVADDGSHEEVDVEYTVEDGLVGFEAEDWDEDKPLVIDPEVQFATWVGGDDSIDQPTSAEYGPNGHLHVATTTFSDDFPTKDGYQEDFGGSVDAAITKFTQDGTDIVWSTFIGGSTTEYWANLEVSDEGDILVSPSYTRSDDYPTTEDAIQPDNPSPGDESSAVSHLSSSGDELLYSTYLGGSDEEEIGIVDWGPNGEMFLAVETPSTDVPTTEGAFMTENPGGSSVALAKIVDGDLAYGTYIGSSGGDDAGGTTRGGIAVDDDGAVYLTGDTDGADFPTTDGAYQTDFQGTHALFVTKIAPDGSALEWSTFLVGDGNDQGGGIALGDDGAVYVGGQTTSSNFPVTDGAYDTQRDGEWDMTLTELSSDGSSVAWSTLFGGTDDEGALVSQGEFVGSLNIAEAEAPYLALSGSTYATDFPAIDAIFEENPGGYSNVVSTFTLDGEPFFSTYYGTDSDDLTYGGDAHGVSTAATGFAWSGASEFPTSPNAWLEDPPGGGDTVGYAVDINVFAPPSVPVDLTAEAGPGAGEVSLDWSAPADEGDASIEGYNIYRATEGGTLTELASTDGTSFVDTGLDDGTTYVYAVSAENKFGEGSLTDTVEATTFGTPSAPLNLNAQTAGLGPNGLLGVQVDWDAPEDATRAGLDEYVVYRATGSAEEFEEYARVDADSTSFTDGPVAGVTDCLYYHVTAVNGVALEGPASGTDSANVLPLVDASIHC